MVKNPNKNDFSIIAASSIMQKEGMYEVIEVNQLDRIVIPTGETSERVFYRSQRLTNCSNAFITKCFKG